MSASKKGFNIAVVGATGLVGSTLLQLLAERAFPINKLYLLASAQSAGKLINYENQSYQVDDLASFDFSLINLAFFCVGNDLSAKYAPIAVKAGCTVIDKSFYYRNNDEIPLIVPEVNMDAVNDYPQKKLIASPNCNTIPLAVGLKPIYDAVGIKRINVATYQSVSGTGKEAVLELKEQTQQLLSQQNISPRVYSQQIAFNVLPHCDDFQDNGYTREEMKIVWELRKIFNDKHLAINPTAVRVPVFCGHAASVHIETKKKITQQTAEQILAKAPGIKLVTGGEPYATPVRDAAGKDLVYVGRVREDISHEFGLNLWIVADNLRKGAGLNSIQIAEHLLSKQMIL